jgi:hypothetical protein
MDFSITAQIPEMDFSEYKTKKRVEMDFSTMFAQVRGWTSADWNRPGLVQCSPRIFWTGVEPVQ